jgi:hypothetical protein
MTAAERFSCTPASLQRGESIAGTATHVRMWLLLEHSGPWGRTALRDAKLPEGLGASLQETARRHRAKVLLIRRPRAARDPDRLNVFAAYAHPERPRLEHGTVADARDVLDLDLGALRDGGTSGLDVASGPIFCVCTNGRHDACCAEFGRPAAMALNGVHPDLTWEISHIGGDRFAGNMVILPEGLYYGRLDAETAVAAASAHLSGSLDLKTLRGRSSHPMPVQAAEIALRRELGLLDIAAVEVRAHRFEDGITDATFGTPADSYRVRVRTILDPATATRLTCNALRDNPVPRHEVLSVEPVHSG